MRGSRLQRWGPVLGRYAQAGGGPVATAAAHFFLSFALLHRLEPSAFGAFSFLLIISQLSWGVWSALFCAPLPALRAAKRQDETGAVEGLLSANVLGALAATGCFFLLGRLVGAGGTASCLFGIYGGSALLRWFARSYAYAMARPGQALASDLVYCGGLFAGVGAMMLHGSADLGLIYAVMSASAIAGLAPFGAAFLRRLFAPRLKDLPSYGQTWKRYSGWSLLGVLTTELTGNAQAYLVTWIYGPAAFSVVAATALLTRPVGVAMNGLTEFERARMAGHLTLEGRAKAFRGARVFRAILVLAWVGNVLAASIVLGWAPRLVFPQAYGIGDILLGTALWFLVAGIRVLRTAESVLLQAAGEFRPLAYASVVSAGLSLAAVAALSLSAGVIWSVAGVAVGEAIYAAFIWRALLRWRSMERDLVQT